jgi:hypothetical protein
MDAEKPHSLRGLIVRIILTVFCLLVLYVLSIGPATYYHAKSELLLGLTAVLRKSDRERVTARDKAYESYCHPIEKATKGTFLQEPLERYMEWWRERGYRANSRRVKRSWEP